MKTYSLSLLVMVAIVALFSCTSQVKVTTDYNRSVDFSKYKTFAFYQLSDHGPGLSQLNQERIINAIKSQLLTMGFTENKENPDLWVNATAIVKEKTQVTANSNYYGYGGYYRPYGWGPGFNGTTTYNTYEYKDGSLIIDLIDAASKTLVWQGTGNKEIDKPSKDPDAAIKAAVAKIMESYPPGGDKKTAKN
ncbi:DUF4136 domain-containing protein [Flavihumibacter petaseus]|uniref:DUF4136 domain-containing protein n=1 Tax=Flavihumibacter petaseus NBRC 106054 TaxID=1220578 RepID=A0A0E9MY71_9BACT|nr:DUF4136 domain-containing protein [Flavihumibacter petaseus]GAO42682.1 hypothetical protein FPE01S_01_16970 [Flavihumibacter petaseus NBRC 106054]